MARKEFGSGELVLGGFRSLRFFRLSMLATPVLWSINNGFYFDDPDRVYTSECFKTKNPVEQIVSIRETERGNIIHVRVGTKEIPEGYSLKVLVRPFAGRDKTTLNERTHTVTHAEIAAFQHPSPGFDCTCGFYSFYGDLGSEEYAEAIDRFGCSSGHVMGVVENSGRVIHGTRGLRSEKIRILGLTFVGQDIADVPERWSRFCLSESSTFNKTDMIFETEEQLREAYPTSPSERIFDVEYKM